MPDPYVGILLNLTSDEVQELKSCIRHHLRSPTVVDSTFDIYHPALAPTAPTYRELLCRGGAARLGWHLSPSKETTLIRSTVAFAVSLDFPHLFKEPASLEEYRREWVPNAFECYSIVPHQFRRDILARLIDICAEDMKEDKRLRYNATDPKPYFKKPALPPELRRDASENKRAHIEPPQANTSNNLKRSH
ncbi:unnamed protein product [Aureobasidium mustum]|uniref:Uncharacterized protein n=1 Tax=Aureobasidium mustum TaxID=2773714 RepID=A0A9N8PKE1_9PEZI|nr:unnamed protein product [Aureobasidium mustum]